MRDSLRLGAGRAAARAAALFLLWPGIGSAAPRVVTPAPPPVPSEAVRAAARTIQNVCFSLYPPDLIAAMTGSTAPVPAEVGDDPARQMKYLSAEKRSDQGLFYPSSLEDILPGLMTEVRAGRSFLDLGSGDGRVVFMAAVLGAQATGIEYEPELHDLARAALRRLEGSVVPKERVRLLRGDFYEHDWSPYEVFFYFGKGTVDEAAMLEKMRRTMRPDAVLVIAHRLAPPEGFRRVVEHGVVSTWRRDPQDLPGESAAPPDAPKRR